MIVEFGLSLPAGPPKNQPHKFLDDLEATLPTIEKYFKSLWMTDHFFWDDNPTFEGMDGDCLPCRPLASI